MMLTIGPSVTAWRLKNAKNGAVAMTSVAMRPARRLKNLETARYVLSSARIASAGTNRRTPSSL